MDIPCQRGLPGANRLVNAPVICVRLQGQRPDAQRKGLRPANLIGHHRCDGHDPRIASKPDQFGMKGIVGCGPCVEVCIIQRAIHDVDCRCKWREVVIGVAETRGVLCREAFQFRQNFIDFTHVRQGKRQNAQSLSWTQFNQALNLKYAGGLTNRGPRHSEPFGKFRFQMI